MSKYSDRPLVVGSVVGERYFNIDNLGRLVSLNAPVPFLPGVNEAVCRKEIYQSGMWIPVYVGMGHYPSEVRVTATHGGHQVAGLDCSCGYYAFFERAGVFKGAFGIIEGTGVCTVGQLGFRAERAQLLALVRPKWVAPNLWDRVLHNYPDVTTYAKKSRAREAHPLTIVNPLTPETCEDFWTRAE